VGLIVCVGIVIALILYFITGTKDSGITARQEPSVRESESTLPPDAGQTPASGHGGASPSGSPGRKAEGTTHRERTPYDANPHRRPALPMVSLPPDADSFDLGSVVLPHLPYCIYAGAHKDFLEAATTQSELDSNYLPAYIVPVDIKGNVAQSLFGVTQDGLWYRVMTGHFSSKEDARKTLAIMMEELPGYQPEIMRFPYTLECGRFLSQEEARDLSELLDKKDVFHYTQTYPTSDGTSLTRVLVGCFFSERGAEDEARRLEDKGLSCTLTDR
jgi:hypothetical protein